MSESSVEREKLYLVDGSSFLYRAFFALPYLSTKKGLPTRVIFGFLKMLNKIINEHRPNYLTVVFDSKGKTFRHNLLADYKIKRPPTPHEIVIQFPYILKLLELLAIKTIIKEGVEADDVIATLAQRFKGQLDVVLVSSDKDLYQLTEHGITIWHPQKERFIDKEAVKEIVGVYPNQLADYLALLGDVVDGIPGVKGIGEKTALRLINDYGSIEKIYESIECLPQRLKDILLKGREIAFLSKKLCELVSVDIDVNLDELKLGVVKKRELLGQLRELEFFDLIKEMGLSEEAVLSIPPVEDYRGIDIVSEKIFLFAYEKKILFTEGGKKVYRVSSHFDEFVEKIKEKKCYAVEGKNLLKLLFENKIYDLKFCDLSLMSYLLNATANHSHSLEDLIRDYYGFVPEDVKSQIDSLFPEDREEKRTAIMLSNLPKIALKILSDIENEPALLRLYEEIEKPLSEILARMERWGVKVDVAKLKEINEELEKRLQEMEERIYQLVGERFNINSPKQMASILYDKLGIKPVKKGKKSHSTSADVLEEIYDAHPVIPLLLEYRNFAKIKNTYLDALPNYVGQDGRIHTTFNQTLTATGRLSSSNPNLQNIPIKYEWGEKIRRAFIADDGYFLISADYSQIEIRILAELSRDEGLIEDFRKRRDIHTMTASKIFNVSPEQVTKEMRRVAKTINFGILYGMGRYSLARELKISTKEAEDFINRYFENYPKVKEFREALIEKARQEKYVTTLFGRKRYIYEIDSPDNNVRQNAERIAINTPLQGTAADIVKKAMIEVYRELSKRKILFKILLQIHDELVIEVEETKMYEAMAIIKEKMEGIVDFTVPLEVKIGVGKNWYEAAR